MRLPRLLCLLPALLLVLPRIAQASDPFARGIDLIGTKLSLGLDGFLSVEGARTPPARSWQLQLAVDYASGLMALKSGDEKLGDLIESRLDLHLLGSYAVTDWAELGIDIPVTAWQRDGFERLGAAAPGFDTARPASRGMGDARLLGKLRLLSQSSASPVTLSVLAELRLPTGDGESFFGERGLSVGPRAVIERGFESGLRLAFEGGYRYRSSPGQFLNLYVGDELTAGLAASYRLPRSVLERWEILGELQAATPARAPFTFSEADALKTPLGAMLGIRAGFGDHLQATIGAATGLATRSGFGRESFRVFALLAWERVFLDRDGDGIADDEDLCPDVPEDRDGFEDSDGCPDPDNDKDGIPDSEDRCPDQPGPARFQGCPDSDKDGVPDHEDKCPGEPGLAEHDGCPDKDGDDVPDHVDRCPAEVGPARNDGCPGERPYVSYESGKLVIKGAINFDSGKATIKKDSFVVLDEAAALLLQHTKIKRLRIDGHTDSVGGAKLNLDLSRRRAKSVMEYLVGKGVEAARLSSEGYGLERPVAPNTTAIGRAQNRRVEFTVLE